MIFLNECIINIYIQVFFLLSATTRKINALDNEFELYWHHNDATVFPFVFQNTLKEQ